MFRPQDSLLLDGDGYGVLTLEDGIPVEAHHTGTGRGGPEAVADPAVPGPYSVELYRHPADERETIHGPDDRQSSRNAGRTAGGRPELAAKTRERAPERPTTETETSPTSAVEAFLQDEEKIAAIREQAREKRPNDGPRSGGWTNNWNPLIASDGRRGRSTTHSNEPLLLFDVRLQPREDGFGRLGDDFFEELGVRLRGVAASTLFR